MQRSTKFNDNASRLPGAAFRRNVVGGAGPAEKDAAHLAINLQKGTGALLPTGWCGTVLFSVPEAQAALDDLRGRGVQWDDPQGVPEMVNYADFYDLDGIMLQAAFRS